MSPLFAGFALSFSLILAIGAQNAFVLKQGLLRRHVFAVCLFCGLSDALLIAAGVSGFGALAAAAPWIEPFLRYGGAAFLVWYGWRSAVSAWAGGDALEARVDGTRSLPRLLATLAAITWLNPHVYLDTLVLIGSVAAQSPAPRVFGLGAVAASFVFFFALGYGARLLAPVLRRQRAWQVLEALVALVMWSIAASLLMG